MKTLNKNFLSDFSPATCNGAPLVNINENRTKQLLDRYSCYGFIVIGYGNSDFDKIKEIISTVKSQKYSYMPIYGSFNENLGEERETQTFEKSFVIFNYDNKQHCEVGEFSKLIQFAIDLAQQFNQDSFLYCEPNKNLKYVKTDGTTIAEYETDTPFNDLTKEYWTDLHQNSHQQPTQSTFTGCYINPAPQCYSERHVRYLTGEIFISF
jgi:hypothetical protein